MSRFPKLLITLAIGVAALWAWSTVRDDPPTPPSASAPQAAPTATSASPAPATAGSVASPAAPDVLPSSAASEPVGREESARLFAASMVRLDERRLLDVSSAESMTAAVASSAARGALVEQAIRQTNRLHEQLGADLSMWAQPLRARTIRADERSAVVDVWWVKVISGPARLTAGDIWGTTRFTLTWESGTWKTADEQSHLGPWPTHATDVGHPSGATFIAELSGFTEIGPQS